MPQRKILYLSKDFCLESVDVVVRSEVVADDAGNQLSGSDGVLQVLQLPGQRLIPRVPRIVPLHFPSLVVYVLWEVLVLSSKVRHAFVPIKNM